MCALPQGGVLAVGLGAMATRAKARDLAILKISWFETGQKKLDVITGEHR
jgi:hypothetical protein